MARPRPALIVAGALAAGAVAAVALLRPSGDVRVDDRVRVVKSRAARPAPAATMAAPPSAPARPIAALLAEAPPAVAALHARVATDGRDTAIESRMGDVFSANSALGVSALTVVCGGASCEVHGTAAGDETAARLAIRSPDFLDAVERLGYTAGTDMISARGSSSEFVVYLDRAG